MKEQYVGDINDYRKYALLRRLQQFSGLQVGVCWMLTPGDSRNDGSLTAYLQKPDNSRHDPELFRVLQQVVDMPGGRALASIEGRGILDRATFFNDSVPDQLFPRQKWFRSALKAVASTDLVFFDPDNGLDVRSKPMGATGSSKYLYREELARAAEDHSVLLYQHFPRVARDDFLAAVSLDLGRLAPETEIWAFRTGYVAFLLLIHARHYPVLSDAARSVSNDVEREFLAGECVRTRPVDAA